MPRGGSRPGAGRPKTAKSPKALPVAPDIKRAAKASKLSPLDYMLTVLNDAEADAGRRDRMAVAAAPYCHPKQSEAAGGKKEAAAEAATTAGTGSSWGNDLMVPSARPN